MNCSLLDDEDYEEDIARMIPLWIAEGQKEFTDNRMIWDWNHVKKHIRKLCINGKITSAPHCVLKEQERFLQRIVQRQH